MKKEWFEIGNKESPFGAAYHKEWDSGTSAGESISAAFRALLAEDSPAVELRVGDVVRLERYENNPNGLSWFESEAHLIGTEEKITRVYEDGTVWLSVGTSWPVSACTLVRRAGEVDGKQEENRNGLKWFDVHLLHAELHARNDEIVGLRAEVEGLKERIRHRRDFESQRDLEYAHWQNIEVPDIQERMQDAERERDAARAEVERLKNECSDQQRYVLDLESAITRKETRIKVLEVANDSLTQYSSNLTAERDALQARIDAGVRAWSEWKQQCGALWLWAFPGCSASPEWAAVCNSLDAQPIADHIVEPNKMVDERKGERRKGAERPCQCPCGGWRLNHEVGDPSSPDMRFHEQRVNPTGTRADRKGN